MILFSMWAHICWSSDIAMICEMSGKTIMSFTIWRVFWRRRDPKEGSKTMTFHLTNDKIGTFYRDGDRSRQPAAPCHGFGRIPGSIFGARSMKKIRNIEPKNHHRLGHPKSWKWCPKGYRNATTFDAQRHKQSMLKQVWKNIMKIIKHNVPLKCRNVQAHCKNNGFRRCAG